MALGDLTGGDPVETRALLDDFLASTPATSRRWSRRAPAGDLAGVTREAHKIKGAARIVGAVELAETAGAAGSRGARAGMARGGGPGRRPRHRRAAPGAVRRVALGP